MKHGLSGSAGALKRGGHYSQAHARPTGVRVAFGRPQNNQPAPKKEDRVHVAVSAPCPYTDIEHEINMKVPGIHPGEQEISCNNNIGRVASRQGPDFISSFIWLTLGLPTWFPRFPRPNYPDLNRGSVICLPRSWRDWMKDTPYDDYYCSTIVPLRYPSKRNLIPTRCPAEVR